MGLKNSQYHAIMRKYEQKQLHSHDIQVARYEEVYKKLPEFKTLDDSIASLSVQYGKKLLDGDMSKDEIKTLAGNVALELGCNVDEKTGYISKDISMERGQALHIDLALTGNENRYEVKSWYVYDSGNYEIDDSMPVWGGN